MRAGSHFGDPHEIGEAQLVSAIQVIAIGVMLHSLESLAPAEAWSDRRLPRVDRIYTLLMLFGLNPLFASFVLTPLAHALGGATTVADADTASGLARWLPWFDHHPLLLFAVYYVVYDLLYNRMDRAQHAIPWWADLHSMHHSQRQMSCWTNDRGSCVDGFLQSIVLASASLLVGVDPEQFALLMFVGELAPNLSHTSVRFCCGRLFERVFVDPRFHRLHHMIVDPERPRLHDCNYDQVWSTWDGLFGTTLHGEAPRPTGVGDPMVDIDNERGLIAMRGCIPALLGRIVDNNRLETRRCRVRRGLSADPYAQHGSALLHARSGSAIPDHRCGCSRGDLRRSQLTVSFRFVLAVNCAASSHCGRSTRRCRDRSSKSRASCRC